MDAVLRATAIYVGLLVIVRVSGKRTLAQITVFDFVLLLVVAEATQQGLLGDDVSVTNALLVILTLIGIERTADLLSVMSGRFDRLLEGGSVVILEDGRANDERLRKLRISLDDILEQARASQGVERLDQIKYAVVERSGSISIIPKGG